MKSKEPIFKYVGNQGLYFGVIILATKLFQSGAIALPPFILIPPPEANNHDLLKHEYGHFLQFLILGILTHDVLWTYLCYLLLIGLPSLWSAYRAGINKKHFHQNTYTEKSANQLSYWFNLRPSTWNFEKYPVYIR